MKKMISLKSVDITAPKDIEVIKLILTQKFSQ